MTDDADDVQLYRLDEKLYPDFDYDKWARYLVKWRFSSHRDDSFYEPFADYRNIELLNQELVALKQHLHPLLRSLVIKIDQLITEANSQNKLFFFRMSTRSPKDAWMHLSPELDVIPSDSLKTQCTKHQQQINFCRSPDSTHILKLVAMSERLQSDLDLHIEKASSSHCMSFVFVPWKVFNVQNQIRVFVRGRSPIAWCPYLSEILAQEERFALMAIADKIIPRFVEVLCDRLPAKYQDFVLDVYEHSGDIFLIELNPFDIITDPIEFTWDQLKDM